MNQTLSPHRTAETLSTLCRHWEEKRKAAGRLERMSAAPHLMTIALSREAGTDGVAVGREVGTRLGWPVYDHELLDRIALDLGVRAALLESVDERHVNWLKEAFEFFFGVPFVSELEYVHRLVKVVLALGCHGECVIVGRAAFLLLPTETTLRVRLIAPVKERIASLSKRLHISEKDAAHRVETLDRERRGFVHDVLSRDPADPQYYDVLLNSSRFGAQGSAEMIVHALDGVLRARRLVGRETNQRSN